MYVQYFNGTSKELLQTVRNKTVQLKLAWILKEWSNLQWFSIPFPVFCHWRNRYGRVNKVTWIVYILDGCTAVREAGSFVSAVPSVQKGLLYYVKKWNMPYRQHIMLIILLVHWCMFNHSLIVLNYLFIVSEKYHYFWVDVVMYCSRLILIIYWGGCTSGKRLSCCSILLGGAEFL